MQLKQFYNIATKVSSRKKCYYFWWSTWLLITLVSMPADNMNMNVIVMLLILLQQGKSEGFDSCDRPGNLT